MNRDYWTTVTVELILLIVLAFLLGMAIGSAHCESVAQHDLTASGSRELIEGGGMPCVCAEKPSIAAETESVEEIVEETQNLPLLGFDGKIPSPDLQAILYRYLSERNIGYMFDLSVCQIQQESSWNPYAENPNGLDKGLCQFRITYWDRFARESGLVTYDIFNPIDQLYVYAYLMEKYLREEGTVDGALSKYYTGVSGYNATYVNAVRQWLPKLQWQ